VSLSFLILVACSSGPVTITVNKPFVFFELFTDKKYYNNETGKDIFLDNIHFYISATRDPFPENLDLTINGKNPDYFVYQNVSNSIGLLTEGHFFNEPLNGSKKFEITTCGVTLYGTISIPDSIKIISPNNGDTTSIDSIVGVIWKGKADWYEIRILAYDSTNISPLALDTISFSASFSFPAKINSNITKRLKIYVNGANGPYKTSGCIGNIQGDGGYGFVNAFNRTYGTDSITVYIMKQDNKKSEENKLF
jgi:hypothetical protein